MSSDEFRDKERKRPEGGPLEEFPSIRPSHVRPDQTIRIEGSEVAHLRSGEIKRTGSLLVIAGDHADVGNHISVQAEVVIGRRGWGGDEHEVGLPLRDGRSSRRHALVALEGDHYVVCDEGSTNGTQLNGMYIDRKRPLRDGDQIGVGQTLIKFTLVDSAEAAYLRRMERLAGEDELTGLLAQHRFDSLLHNAVLLAHSQTVPLAVLMMDLDGLKAINDRHGHHMGANTIRQVGELIGEIVAGRGEASRFGGDEFCVFLPGVILDRATLMGERIRREVESRTYVHGGVGVRCTISVGVAVLTDATQTGEQLLAKADQALYRAKASGRNVVSK
ncbi:MAG: GGDEF domain-containing protein [Deltaproteobacteria bacterium]|nr:GGDEF domain-containing protein [Deltaproteobacteria bacterium]